jgi:hypothetical protein
MMQGLNLEGVALFPLHVLVSSTFGLAREIAYWSRHCHRSCLQNLSAYHRPSYSRSPMMQGLNLEGVALSPDALDVPVSCQHLVWQGRLPTGVVIITVVVYRT